LSAYLHLIISTSWIYFVCKLTEWGALPENEALSSAFLPLVFLLGLQQNAILPTGITKFQGKISGLTAK
jgi:hypothetical protein